MEAVKVHSKPDCATAPILTPDDKFVYFFRR